MMSVHFDNGLTPEVNQLLQSWKENVDENELIHRTKALRFRSIYYILGVPATIMSGLFTASSLATIPECSDLFALCITQAIFGAIVTTIVGIQTYLQLMSRFIDNKMASDRYQSLSRTIDSLKTTKNKPEDAATILNSIRFTFDDIVNTSPIILSNTKLQYATFNRSTRKRSAFPQEHDEHAKNTDVSISIPEEIKENVLPPATQEELKTLNKDSDHICIDIDLDKEEFRIDPMLKFQMDRLESV